MAVLVGTAQPVLSPVHLLLMVAVAVEMLTQQTTTMQPVVPVVVDRVAPV